MMKRIQVSITSNFENVPNFDELLQQEHAAVGKWKEQGILEHLFVKDTNDGAVLVFKDSELKEVGFDSIFLDRTDVAKEDLDGIIEQDIISGVLGYCFYELSTAILWMDGPCYV